MHVRARENGPACHVEMHAHLHTRAHIFASVTGGCTEALPPSPPLPLLLLHEDLPLLLHRQPGHLRLRVLCTLFFLPELLLEVKTPRRQASSTAPSVPQAAMRL